MICFRTLYAQKHSIILFYQALVVSIFFGCWVIFLIFILSKINLILSLYEVAAQLIYDQPLILLVSFLVSDQVYLIYVDNEHPFPFSPL